MRRGRNDNIGYKNAEECYNTHQLVQVITLFFNTNGKWDLDCLERSEDFDMKYLLCNLFNTNWLAYMLKNTYALSDIKLPFIKKYVENNYFYR